MLSVDVGDNQIADLGVLKFHPTIVNLNIENNGTLGTKTHHTPPHTILSHITHHHPLPATYYHPPRHRPSLALAEIPPELSLLKQLQTLCIVGNPQRVVRADVASAGCQTIQTYLKGPLWVGSGCVEERCWLVRAP